MPTRGIIMDQPTATLIVGLSSSGVAIAAMAATVANTRKTLQQQLDLQRAERLWDKREAVYEDIANWLADHPNIGYGDPSPLPAPPQGVMARAKLFALAETSRAL